MDFLFNILPVAAQILGATALIAFVSAKLMRAKAIAVRRGK